MREPSREIAAVAPTGPFAVALVNENESRSFADATSIAATLPVAGPTAHSVRPFGESVIVYDVAPLKPFHAGRSMQRATAFRRSSSWIIALPDPDM